VCRDGEYWRFDDLNFSVANSPGINNNNHLDKSISHCENLTHAAATPWNAIYAVEKNLEIKTEGP
jgi:hypothetical protein